MTGKHAYDNRAAIAARLIRSIKKAGAVFRTGFVRRLGATEAAAFCGSLNSLDSRFGPAEIALLGLVAAA